MITAIKPDYKNSYEVLFEEASDILSGYRRVNVYDAKIDTYFRKKINEGTKVFEKFEQVSSIKDLKSFADALKQYRVIYVDKDENGNALIPAEGFEPKLGITTLEEYFSWIRNLGGINRKYTMLPLDEPHFVINADTRAIEVPPEFKKNGIAVQGDDIAEVVYFEIDRYFDYIDFNNCEIFIEWETPKNGSEPGIKCVSVPYVKDIESKPGKLIFGWAISDRITKHSGTLKFAVRFFEWEDIDNKINTTKEKILSYSFSTLTAQAIIKPGIGFNPKTDYVNPDELAGDRIVQRLENGAVVGGAAAAKPVYTINLVEKHYDLNKTDELVVQAYASDTGAISYSWRKQSIAENTVEDGVSGEIINLTGENVYEEVKDNQILTSHYVYYQNTGTKNDPIYVATPYNSANLPSGDNANIVLYEKKSKINPDSAGIYWAIAENRLSNSINEADSFKAVFPKPSAVNITKNLNTESNHLNGDLELSVNVSNNDGIIYYQWYKDENYQANGYADENFEPFGDEENLKDSSNKNIFCAPDGQGHYKVLITNTRNGSEKSAWSNVARVTNVASEPKVVYPLVTHFFANNLSDDNCPSITIVDEQNNFDSYDVEWFIKKDGVLTSITTISLDYKVNICSFNPSNEKYIDTIKNITGNDNIDGLYLAQVTKKFNGSEATLEINDSTPYFDIDS